MNKDQCVGFGDGFGVDLPAGAVNCGIVALLYAPETGKKRPGRSFTTRRLK